MSVVSISSSDMAARAVSSFFCFGVRVRPSRFSSAFLDTLRIDSPFPARCLPGGQDANHLRVVGLIKKPIKIDIEIECMGDYQHVNSVDHSDGLPARFTIDLAVLR